jgi:hypothetical protein
VASYRRPVKRSELMCDIREVLLRVRPTLTGESEETLLRLSYRVWMPAMDAARHGADPSFCYIPARALEADFGRANFTRLTAKHNIFEVLEADTRPGRWTRGFRLVRDIDLAVNNYVRRIDERLPTLATRDVITRDGKRVVKPPRAIASENSDGVAPKAWAGARVPNSVCVDSEMMDAYATHLRRYATTGGRMIAGTFVPFTAQELEPIRYRERVLSRLIGLANSTLGGQHHIPIRYVEQPCGRAFGDGLNLQNAPGDIRDVTLHGNWDIDLSNCHYSLLLQLAALVRVELPEVRWYLDNKDTVREGLAGRIGIEYDEAKGCLIALIYGARFSLHKECEIVKLIGPTRARKLYADPQFRALKDDVQRARTAILRTANARPIVFTSGAGPELRVAEVRRLGQERLFNAVGSSIDVRETEGRRRGKRRKPAELLAHILQGLEAKIMRVIVDSYSDDVLLLMHDGLVSRRELPVSEMMELIYNRTGLRMSLGQEKIEVPRALGTSEIVSQLSH